jgi:hypothetical protein
MLRRFPLPLLGLVLARKLACCWHRDVEIKVHFFQDSPHKRKECVRSREDFLSVTSTFQHPQHPISSGPTFAGSVSPDSRTP